MRIQLRQELDGICRHPSGVSPESLWQLIGLDPFKLFDFGTQDRTAGAAQPHQALLTALSGCDIALIDLLGQALKARSTCRSPTLKSEGYYNVALNPELSSLDYSRNFPKSQKQKPRMR